MVDNVETAAYKPGGPAVYEQERRSKRDTSRREYDGNEDTLVCARFPHLAECTIPGESAEALNDIALVEVHGGIFMGPFQAAFKTKELIDLGITHILDVSCKAYTPRDQYFKYLSLPIQDTTGEDVRKHFRITNRFIRQALNSGGNILVHSVNGRSRAPTFILAYMIESEKHKLKDGLAMVRRFVPEVEPNEGFMQQLAEYDLELLQRNE